MLSRSRPKLRSRKCVVTILAATCLATIAVWLIPQALGLLGERSRAHKPAVAYLGSAERLHAAYTRWAADHEAQGGDRHLTFALRWSKGLSAEFTEATGLARLDLIGGAISVEVRGLAATTPWEVWLIDNQPGAGRSVIPEPGDTARLVGRLRAEDGVSRLEAQLGSRAFAEFEVDLVVVARAGWDPSQRGLLFAAPSLFHRLYTRARLGRPAVPTNEDGSLLVRLGRHLAHAAPPVASLDPLVVRGSQLFFDETFDGNGRTCGTCHPAQNNFTIDPAFIATLPPNDPLFVAEFTPALKANFENPKLMRQVGLILENLDGFDNLPNKFVMRGVPHILALNTSLTPATFDGTTIPPKERTGWSGDGAPGSGTLREFAIGAVTQHFTRTLNRVPGVDFRLPTDEELDALEAFQRFVGRNQDPDLAALRLKGVVPRRGLEIFLTNDTNRGTVPAGKCGQCHENAGASVGGINANFATGTEQLTEPPADLIDPRRNPPDGGFGTARSRDVPGFGNGTFNTPPLVEAADTGPFFHNNAVSTIEGAVAFFNSEAFRDSPSGQFLASQDTGGLGIRLEPAQIEAIAAFLRVLNALENIRGSIELLRFTLDVRADGVASHLLRLAIQEQWDAVRVLDGAGLHPVAVQRLNNAIERTRLASAASFAVVRNVAIHQAIAEELAARRDMIQE